MRVEVFCLIASWLCLTEGALHLTLKLSASGISLQTALIEEFGNLINLNTSFCLVISSILPCSPGTEIRRRKQKRNRRFSFVVESTKETGDRFNEESYDLMDRIQQDKRINNNERIRNKKPKDTKGFQKTEKNLNSGVLMGTKGFPGGNKINHDGRSKIKNAIGIINEENNRIPAVRKRTKKVGARNGGSTGTDYNIKQAKNKNPLLIGINQSNGKGNGKHVEHKDLRTTSQNGIREFSNHNNANHSKRRKKKLVSKSEKKSKINKTHSRRHRLQKRKNFGHIINLIPGLLSIAGNMASVNCQVLAEYQRECNPYTSTVAPTSSMLQRPSQSTFSMVIVTTDSQMTTRKRSTSTKTTSKKTSTTKQSIEKSSTTPLSFTSKAFQSLTSIRNSSTTLTASSKFDSMQSTTAIKSTSAKITSSTLDPKQHVTTSNSTVTETTSIMTNLKTTKLLERDTIASSSRPNIVTRSSTILNSNAATSALVATTVEIDPNAPEVTENVNPTNSEIATSAEGENASSGGNENPSNDGNTTPSDDGNANPSGSGDTTLADGGNANPSDGENASPSNGGETAPADGQDINTSNGGETTLAEGGNANPVDGENANLVDSGNGN